jgi:tripartite-type tricarboxylate transporter receptor subunit TctC
LKHVEEQLQEGAMRRKFLRNIGCLAGMAALLAASAVSAQTYPSKPIRLVVPYAPGGGVDLVGRILARRLTDSLGTQVVVENRPGAGAMIGIDNVAKAAPDGYTLLVVDPAFVINTSIHKKTSYQLKDLQPISVLTSSPLLLTVTSKLPINDLPSLLQYAKMDGAKANFASAGVGTSPHMAGELLRLRGQSKIVHVPYKGSGPAMQDLVSGEVQMAFTSIAAALPYVKDGRLKAIATSASKRATGLPDVPTVMEAGVPNFDVTFWTVLLVPAGLPQDILAKLNAEATNALRHPETVATLAKVSETPAGTTLEAAAAFVQAEHAKWAQVVKEGNLQDQ